MNSTPESDPSAAYAGPREEQSLTLVLIGGLITTALALLGVYLLDVKTDDFHIMGWYANYLIPAGAILVGLAASSGYGIASWVSGIKITRRLLWIVLALQLATYFVAQYIEFKGRNLVYEDGQPVGFLTYFDLAARSFAWKQKDGSSGEPMGVWGYAFRGLEILGFVGGSLIVPLVMTKSPYCQACQRYMRTRQIGLLPASVLGRKVKKSDAAGMAAYEAEQQKAFAAGKQAVETLQALATGNKTADFQKHLAEINLAKKQTLKLPGRISAELVHCRRCHSGRLHFKLLLGHGNQVQNTEISRTDLHPEFVRTISP